MRDEARREIEENAERAFEAYARMLEQGVAQGARPLGAAALDLHEVLLELQPALADALLRPAQPRDRPARDPPYAAAAEPFLDRLMPITHAAFVANDRTAP